MKTTFTLALALCACLFFASCKTTSPTAPANDAGTPTAEGTAVGTAATATIDAAGGSLRSLDGKLEVIIPAGALSAATPISIQPGTNEAPLGIGAGFSLTPNGQKFDKPITLRFHFAQADLAGTDINVLTVATQKDDHIWYAFNNITLDSAAGTISITTSHFSWYTILEYFHIVPTQATIKVNNTQALRVDFVPIASKDNDATDDLSPLNSPDIYANGDQVSWTINGNLQANQSDGKVSPSSASSKTTYTAPASTKNMSTNPVSVTALVSLPGNNQFFKTAKKLYLISNIKVTDDGVQVYKIDMHFSGTKMAVMSDFTFDYTQDCSFTATLLPNEDTVRYGDIVNGPGQIGNWKEKNSVCTHKATDQGDFMHIKGFLQDFVGQSTGQPVRIYPHPVTSFTTFTYTTDCGAGPKTTKPTTNDLIYAPESLFILDGTTQTKTDPVSGNTSGVVVTFTLTPQ
jgi:hypothetical protein